MKLPFVLRSKYDKDLTKKNRECAELEADIILYQDAIRDKLEIIKSYKEKYGELCK